MTTYFLNLSGLSNFVVGKLSGVKTFSLQGRVGTVVTQERVQDASDVSTIISPSQEQTFSVVQTLFLDEKFE